MTPNGDAQRSLAATILDWSARGASAISDQGLFAVSNFVINVLLARWLSPPDYGAFSLAFSVFLLVGTLHTGFLTEPMLVFGPGRRLATLHNYFRTVLQAHWMMSILLAIVLTLVAILTWALQSSQLAQLFLGLAAAAPLILLQWLARRMCYAILKPHYAAYAGSLYMPVLFSLTYLLHRTSSLSPLSALLIMGVSSGITAYALLKRLNVALFPKSAVDRASREVFAEHWSYGKWAASIQLLNFVSGSSYYLLIAIWAGFDATGLLRANMNLVLPIIHATSALGAILLPSLVRLRGTRGFYQLVRWGSVALFALGITYWAILGWGYDLFMQLLYGGDQYTVENVGWALGLVTVGAGTQSIFASGLYALERPDRVLPAYAIAAGVALTIGLGMMLLFGVIGAIIGIALANASAVIVSGRFFYQLCRGT